MKPEQRPITGMEDLEPLTRPLRALSRFYHAFNHRDLDKMAENWAAGEEVSMANPVGGIKRGWPEIKALYERIFKGPAEVTVEFFDYTLHQQEDIFYAVGRERGEFRLGGIVLPLAIRTTRVYRLIGGKWRQVHHHGSFEAPELLASYQEAIKAGA
jgi:ketosteroid isomerase-like protein